MESFYEKMTCSKISNQCHTKLYAVSILKNLARKNRMRNSSSVRGGTQMPRSTKKKPMELHSVVAFFVSLR